MKSKKRVLSLLLALLLSLTLLFAGMPTAHADTFFEEGDFRYAVVSGDAVKVAAYLGNGTAVTLPDTVGGRAVTGVYSHCFENSNVTAVTLPAGYTTIGSFAFQGCTSLTAMTLPATLTTIGLMAFDGCTALETFDFASTALTAVGFAAFNNCTALEAAILPDTVQSIGENAFCGCESLSELRLPENIATLPEYAFYGCTALESVSFPASLAAIGESCFENASLTGVYVPETVTSIGVNAFAPGNDIICFNTSAAAAYCDDCGAQNARIIEKIIGDATLDGVVTIADVTAIQRHLAELEELAVYALLLADTNGSGDVSVDDATLIQAYLAEFNVSFVTS